MSKYYTEYPGILYLLYQILSQKYIGIRHNMFFFLHYYPHYPWPADDDGVDDTGEVETSVIEEEEGAYLVPESDFKEVSLEIVEGDKAGSK